MIFFAMGIPRPVPPLNFSRIGLRYISLPIGLRPARDLILDIVLAARLHGIHEGIGPLNHLFHIVQEGSGK